MPRQYGTDRESSPDLTADATSIDLPEYVSKVLRDLTLTDLRTLVPGAAHTGSRSTAFTHFGKKRQKQVSPAYQAVARSLEAVLDSQPISPGPIKSELSTFDSKKV